MNAPCLRLEKFDVLVIDDVWMEAVHSDRQGMTLKAGVDGRARTYSNQELLDLYFEKRLKIVRRAHTKLDARVADVLKKSYLSFDERWQQEMLRRLDYVQACDYFFTRMVRHPRFSQRPEKKGGYQRIANIVARYRQAQAAFNAGKPLTAIPLESVSGSALRDWRRRWIAADREMVALVPLHHIKGKRRNELDENVVRIIGHWVRETWLTLERPPVTIVHALICRHLKDMRAAKTLGQAVPDPSKMAVHRWIKANIGEYERVAGREGRKAAQAKVRAVRPAPPVGIPLRVVEIDHTRLDIILVHKNGEPVANAKSGEDIAIVGRPWLTTAIDAETRMIVGFHLTYDAPSWTSVMRTLRMAVLEKDLSDIDAATGWPVMGVPEIVKLDNGREFHSASLHAAAGQLKFELRYCRRGRPQLKGRVERFFGEVARDYCALFPGRTFANIAEKADYKPEEHARMTLDQAQKLFKLWVVDIYHNKPHSGLMGKTPLCRWTELSGFGVRLPPKADDLAALLGLVVQRKISRTGVNYLGLQYQSEEIELLRGLPDSSNKERVIKIDPEDLSSIFVLDPDNGKWLIATCTRGGLAKGLNIKMWRETCEAARQATPGGQKVSYDALLGAREKLAAAARAMGNKPGKISKSDLAWIEANPDHPIFDVSMALPRRGRGPKPAAGASGAGPSPGGASPDADAKPDAGKAAPNAPPRGPKRQDGDQADDAPPPNKWRDDILGEED
jgi:putative transposase